MAWHIIHGIVFGIGVLTILAGGSFTISLVVSAWLDSLQESLDRLGLESALREWERENDEHDK